MSGRWHIFTAATLAAVFALGALGAYATLVFHTSPSTVVRTATLGQVAPMGDMAVATRLGRVFVLEDSLQGVAQVQVFDTATGGVDRTLGIGRDYPTAVCVDPDTGHLFIAFVASPTSAGYVQTRDARTGRLLRVTPIDEGALALRMVADERHRTLLVASAGLYYGLQPANGSVSILDAGTGRLLRRFQVSGMVTSVGVDGRTNHVIVTSDAAPGSQSHRWAISVLDARNGHLLHKVPVSLDLNPQRIAVDERTSRAFILGTGYKGNVYTIDTRTGRLIGTTRFSAMPTDGAVDESSGRVFVALPGSMVKRSAYAATSSRSGVGIDGWMPAGPGSVVMLDARTGHPIGRAIRVGIAPTALAVDARRRRVLVLNAGARDDYQILSGRLLRLHAPLTAPSSLSVLDDVSGHMLRTIPLGASIDPAAMSLDPESGHAFIAVAGGLVAPSSPHPFSWLPPSIRRWLPFAQPAPTLHLVASNIVVVATGGPFT